MPNTTIHISRPCPETWAAMTPTDAGRHCAACAKTVVDFTQKTNAEMLAYFRQAGEKQGCGRFRASQLTRPLALPAAAATGRWRPWLTALAAVWSLRVGVRQEAQAQLAPPAIAASNNPKPVAPAAPASAASIQITGVVVDSASHEKLPGVTVVLQGTSLGTSSDVNGQFSLTILSEVWQKSTQTLAVSSVGYQLQTIPLPTPNPAPLDVLLAVDNQRLGETIIIGGYSRKPWPWHPRQLYYQARYWLTRPFRR